MSPAQSLLLFVPRQHSRASWSGEADEQGSQLNSEMSLGQGREAACPAAQELLPRTREYGRLKCKPAGPQVQGVRCCTLCPPRWGLPGSEGNLPCPVGMLPSPGYSQGSSKQREGVNPDFRSVAPALVPVPLLLLAAPLSAVTLD